MPKTKLTDAAIQKFKAPPGGRIEYFDASFGGFGIRVAGPTARSPEGRKSWVLIYRYAGLQRRLTIEPGYPALSLADARKRAGDALAELSKGIDPGAAKAATKVVAAKRPDTVENVIEEFLRRHMDGKRRAPDYVRQTRGNFDNHVLPRWRGREIKSITRRDVIELLDGIVDEGTAVKQSDGSQKLARGGPICANRVLAAVRVLFNWALRRGIIDTTPAALVERPGEETRRERVLDGSELLAVWRQAEKLPYPAGPYVRMLMLTGQRREEVASMAWADLDLNNATWVIPAQSTKAKRLHAVPLSPAAVTLLRDLPRKAVRGDQGLVTSPFVFTAAGDKTISHFGGIKRRLDAGLAAELQPWTFHDLRRTAATEMARLGVSRFVIGKVLNHADRGVTGIYDRHAYLPEKRHALESWAAYLSDLLESDSNTVALRA